MVRGLERELTTRPSREAVGAGQQAGVDDGDPDEAVGAGQQAGVDDATRQRAVGAGQQRGEQRVGVEPWTRAVNTGLERPVADKIGSSDSESR